MTVATAARCAEVLCGDAVRLKAVPHDVLDLHAAVEREPADLRHREHQAQLRAHQLRRVRADEQVKVAERCP